MSQRRDRYIAGLKLLIKYPPADERRRKFLTTVALIAILEETDPVEYYSEI